MGHGLSIIIHLGGGILSPRMASAAQVGGNVLQSSAPALQAEEPTVKQKPKRQRQRKTTATGTGTNSSPPKGKKSGAGCASNASAAASISAANIPGVRQQTPPTGVPQMGFMNGPLPPGASV